MNVFSSFIHSVRWLPAALMLTGAVNAQPPSFRVHVENDVAVFGQGVITVDVDCANSLDSVAGFRFWFLLDRPDMGAFLTSPHEQIDTTYWICNTWGSEGCADSVLSTPIIWDFIHIDTHLVVGGALDTTGTLLSGWDWIDSRTLSGFGYDLLASGVADFYPYGDGGALIAPGDSGTMFRLLFQVADNPPPPVVEPPWVVQIMLNTDFADNLELFDRQGQSLIRSFNPNCDTLFDTTLYRCNGWVGDICIDWSVVSVPPYDSMVVDTIFGPCLDTSLFQADNGSVRLLLCGDANGDDEVNVSDLTDLIGYLFGGLPPGKEIYPITMDVDASGAFNISDITFYVAYLFVGGPPLRCF